MSSCFGCCWTCWACWRSTTYSIFSYKTAFWQIHPSFILVTIPHRARLYRYMVGQRAHRVNIFWIAKLGIKNSFTVQSTMLFPSYYSSLMCGMCVWQWSCMCVCVCCVYTRQLKRQEAGEQCCFQLACQSESHVGVGGLYKQPHNILDEWDKRARDRHYHSVEDKAGVTYIVCESVCDRDAEPVGHVKWQFAHQVWETDCMSTVSWR